MRRWFPPSMPDDRPGAAVGGIDDVTCLSHRRFHPLSPHTHHYTTPHYILGTKKSEVADDDTEDGNWPTN